MKTNTYSCRMKIGETEKTVVLATLQEEEKKENTKQSIHHIQLIDRSGSMYDEIDELIEHVKLTVKSMNPEDVFSIITFSGHHDFEVVFQGIPVNNYKLDDILNSLDKYKRAIGTTCFSDPIQCAKEIVMNPAIQSLTDSFSITLFTDGEPVVPWSESEENEKVVSLIREIRNQILAFNTIGYGSHCNRQRLTEWSSLSELGEMIHSSEISDYSKIFKYNHERVVNQTSSRISISVKSPCEVYYSNENSISDLMTQEDKENLVVNHSSNRSNQIIFVSDLKDFEFEINEEKYQVSTSENMRPSSYIPILYKLAYIKYYNGNRSESFSIIQHNLKDKEAIDSHLKSFTYREVENHVKLLKDRAFSSLNRQVDTAPEDYVPRKDSYCVIDFLNHLMSINQCRYIPHDYQRIGRKKSYSSNLFHSTEESYKLIGIDYNKSKLNVNVKFLVNGYVEVPEELKPSAGQFGLSETIPAKRYFSHSVVKDGELNIKELHLEIPSKQYRVLADLINKRKDTVDVSEFLSIVDIEDGKAILVAHLDMLPIVNSKMSQISIDEVYGLVYAEKQLESKIKVLKYRKSKTPSILIESNNTKYTDEQLDFLKLIGVSSDGTYRDPNSTLSSAEDSDFYVARNIEFNLSGFSSIPSVESVINGKSKGTSSKFVREELESPHSDILIDSELAASNARLNDVRGLLAGIKISKILTGGWFTGLVPDSKKKDVYIYSTDKNEFNLTVKTTMTKCYI